VSAVQPSNVLDSVDPCVKVSMYDNHIVISPSTRLDIASTRALISVAASAIRSGSNVMIDLDPNTPSDDLISHGPVSGRPAALLGDGDGSVRLLGPGCIRIATTESYWTIDLSLSRLFRSEKPIELYFVSTDRWTPIRALWASCESITALADDGTYLSCRTVWTT
jgi:hypothetical protein